MNEYAFGYSPSWPELMVAVTSRPGHARVRVTAEGGLKVERTGLSLQSAIDELRAVLREKGFDLSQVEPAFREVLATS